MIIVEPKVEVLAYTQLVPATQWKVEKGPGLFDSQKSIGESDRCSEMSRVVERCGRVSWKSEDKIGPGTADGFMTRVVNIRKDESIAEHASVTMLFTTDRYVSHQLVRHRIAAYTQESTHYINYGKRGDQIEVCKPMGIPECLDDDCRECPFDKWARAMIECEDAYFGMLAAGVKHYHARYALPGCLKTEVAATYNLRTWRHVLGLRTTPNNTPEIAHVMKLAGNHMHALCPEMFEEVYTL